MELTEYEYNTATHALAEHQYTEWRAAAAPEGITLNPQTKQLVRIPPWEELPPHERRALLEAALEIVQVVARSLPDRRESTLQELAVKTDALRRYELQAWDETTGDVIDSPFYKKSDVDEALLGLAQ